MENKNYQTPRVVRTGPRNSRKPRKPQSKTAKITKSVFSTIFKVLVTTILVLTITGCIVGTALTIYVMQFVNAEPAIDLYSLKMNFTSTVYGIDEKGENVVVNRLKSGEDRVWVDLKDVPKTLQDAIIYTEDERFNQHDGVDFKRTFAAFANYAASKFHIRLFNKSFGGSTITQQLIKNINGDIYDRSVSVKVKEIITALNLEHHYSKKQILELYINYVYLNYNNIGMQAGANYYFGKDVSELTINEIACLAGIGQSPVYNNPISGKTSDKRRRYVLSKMLEFNVITKEQYNEVINVPIYSDKEKPQEKPDEDKETPSLSEKYQSYFVDAVMEDVIADLQKKYNYSRDTAEQLLLTGGYQVYTTMDIKMQATLQKYFEDPRTFFDKSIKEYPQGAMLIMDYNGNVKALSGGIGEKKAARAFNRATQAARPAGSTIKPVAVYSQAFEQNLINWSSIMEDSFVINKEKPYDTTATPNWPNNYDKVLSGDVLIINALKVSKNTIPVRLLQLLTPQVSFDFVTKQLGFSHLRPTGAHNDVTYDSMALGGGNVTLKELVGGYQIFGNGGYYIEPKLYTKVLDSEGKVLLDTTTRQKKQVISPQTAYIMNKGLWSVVNDGGSGSAAKNDKIEVIGKTGTSNDRKDLLFMGATPYYIAGIRYGYDEGSKEIPNQGKYYTHIKSWAKIMNEIQKGLNPATFELSDDGVVKYEYCKKTGNLAHSGCPEKGIGYYNINNIPSTCTEHESGAMPTDNSVDKPDDNE